MSLVHFCAVLAQLSHIPQRQCSRLKLARAMLHRHAKLRHRCGLDWIKKSNYIADSIVILLCFASFIDDCARPVRFYRPLLFSMQRLGQSISSLGPGSFKGKERETTANQESGYEARSPSLNEFQAPLPPTLSFSYPRQSSSSSIAGLPAVPQEPARAGLGSTTGQQPGGHNTLATPMAMQSNNESYPSDPQSPTAAMHNLRPIAQLLHAHKVYRAGYLWRLDHHPAANSKLSSSVGSGAEQPHFARYYMRLEDCILCLWSDEGLRQAQSQGRVIHPTSMNITEGFVALASTKNEWLERCDQFKAPSRHTFVVNTAGA